MNNVPFFSIVIPAYNCENTIVSTIRTIQKQVFTDFELIIVNDGSTDMTKQIIENEIKFEEKIKLYSIKNSGPGAARNYGVSKAIGKYLIFVDSDDLVNEKMLENHSKTLLKKNYDLIVSSYRTSVVDNEHIISQTDTVYPTTEIENKSEFLTKLYSLMQKQLMYVVWNKVYKLEIIQNNEIQFPSYSSCEDRLFNIRYFNYIQSCLIKQDILNEYTFDSKNSLTNKYLPNKFETFLDFYDELINLTDQNIQGTNSLFLKGVMSCMMSIHTADSPLNFSEKYMYIKGILLNESVIKASKNALTDSLVKKITLMSFKTKNIILNYIVSYGLYKLNHLSPKLLEKIKKRF
ncbi:glycosyltransferase family 2 protein [Marinilactibacillus psychrotolerans]|uniref:glycosyltransferase family 2 protein n=1 Tax=Marinilactibacillus psychrotolerans TaxID=191770 RepID=UPI003886B5AB